MFDIFGSVKSFIKLESVCIDNNVFRLHYKATVIFLVAFTLLVSSSQYVGDPIDCMYKNKDIPSKLLDTYCWIHSTFSLPDAFNKVVGKEVPYPGVGLETEGEKRVYHKYYQWVCFVLFFQSIMFYIPRYLWKQWEGRRLTSLVMDLKSPILADNERNEQVDKLVQYFKSNMGYHNLYFLHFFICEVLNFINVVMQMYLMDKFLGGEFSTYGFNVINYSEMDQESRVDPMIAVFPRMTKCIFHSFGTSGSVQKETAYCILPINVVNEKIYIFLWFWFYFLAIISAFALVYRLFMIIFPQLRYASLRTRARLTEANYLRKVMDVAKIGDWFLLNLLCKNMDGQNFRKLMQEYSKVIVEKHSEHFKYLSNEIEGLTSKVSHL